MKGSILILAATAVLGCMSAGAQIPPVPATDQLALLKSSDPQLAANKKLVFDMWRELLEAGHMELAEKYLTETYIQHNPNVPTGRQGFVDAFSKIRKPIPIEPLAKAKLIRIVAEGDYVVLTMVREYPDPKDSTKKYSTTWVDMFRIEGGKIAEHWDSALKNP